MRCRSSYCSARSASHMRGAHCAALDTRIAVTARDGQLAESKEQPGRGGDRYGDDEALDSWCDRVRPRARMVRPRRAIHHRSRRRANPIRARIEWPTSERTAWMTAARWQQLQSTVQGPVRHRLSRSIRFTAVSRGNNRAVSGEKLTKLEYGAIQ